LKRSLPVLLLLVSAALILACCAGCESDDDGGDDDDDTAGGDDDDTASDDDDDRGGGTEPLMDRCLLYRDEEWEEPERSDAKLRTPIDDNPYTIGIASEIGVLTADARAIMLEKGVPNLDKHREMQRTLRDDIAYARLRLAEIERDMSADTALEAPAREQVRLGIFLARALLDRLERALDYDVPDLPPSKRIAGHGSYELTLDDAVVERYWKFYHWTEILGAFNDDSEYLHMLDGTLRDDFIDTEIGRHGIEAQMDEWRVHPDIWDDPELSGEQKLMSTKYTLWQNEDWGGGNHYINEYWSWEPAFVDEDCPLFTGNAMAALAAEYGVTRHERTFGRLRNMVDAMLYYDELTIDGPDPLDTGPRNGRLQRGPKMKNLYFEDEAHIWEIEIDEQGIHFHHNNSWPDHQTGRERKNVSRDQYYGLLTGYYTVWSVLNGLDVLSREEEELLCDVIFHMERIVGYLKGPRFNPDHGPEYQIYCLFEGSCANPPNLSFMGYLAADWFTEVSGIELPYWQGGYELLNGLLDLGALIGSLELSQTLFKPAHTSMTALNQYVAALLMSDQPREQWEFLFPGEIIREGSQGQRNLWRRMIATYVFKFGDAGNEDYQSVMDELLSPDFNPPTEVADLYCGTHHGYVKVRPSGWGIEDLMWPLMFVVYTARNSDALGDQLNASYDELVLDGTISFEHTDLEPL